MFRPLPNEYLRYAREDTHYLLYIYDRLRNQLLEMKGNNSELLQLVYKRSKIICQKVRKTSIGTFSRIKSIFVLSYTRNQSSIDMPIELSITNLIKATSMVVN